MTHPVPQPCGATPYLAIRGAAQAIDFYQRAFGATLAYRLDMPDGKVMHAEMKIGEATFMLADECPEQGALSPTALGGSATSIMVYVLDVDAVVAQAVGAGGQLDMPVADQFWGDRCGSLTDPFGHKWFLATHKEDLTPEQIEARAAALFAPGKA